MADKNLPWPDWSKSATKGDLIQAMVGVRTCTVNILVALVALRNDDQELLRSKVNDLIDADNRLVELMDKIGGKASDLPTN